MELMENPLAISSIETILVRAWSYTEQIRVFSPVADDLSQCSCASASHRDERL